jgi:hypothetical protein
VAVGDVLWARTGVNQFKGLVNEDFAELVEVYVHLFLAYVSRKSKIVCL